MVSQIVAFFAHPLAVVGVIVVSVFWARSKRSNNTLTMLLSILAITMTQIVLLDAQRSDAAVQAKLDKLLEEGGRGGGRLIRAEDKDPETIEAIRPK